MGRVDERLPDSRRRVAQLPDENERPLFSVLAHARTAGRAWFVLLAIGHFLLLAFLFVGCQPAALRTMAESVASVASSNAVKYHADAMSW